MMSNKLILGSLSPQVGQELLKQVNIPFTDLKTLM